METVILWLFGGAILVVIAVGGLLMLCLFLRMLRELATLLGLMSKELTGDTREPARVEPEESEYLLRPVG